LAWNLAPTLAQHCYLHPAQNLAQLHPTQSLAQLHAGC
jgi:hypothetical protein